MELRKQNAFCVYDKVPRYNGGVSEKGIRNYRKGF